MWPTGKSANCWAFVRCPPQNAEGDLDIIPYWSSFQPSQGLCVAQQPDAGCLGVPGAPCAQPAPQHLSGSRGLSRQLRRQDPISQPAAGGHLLTVVKLDSQGFELYSLQGTHASPLGTEGGSRRGSWAMQAACRAIPVSSQGSAVSQAASCAKLGPCLSHLSLLPCSIHFGVGKSQVPLSFRTDMVFPPCSSPASPLASKARVCPCSGAHSPGLVAQDGHARGSFQCTK